MIIPNSIINFSIIKLCKYNFLYLTHPEEQSMSKFYRLKLCFDTVIKRLGPIEKYLII
jgi:hypothetical protein